VSRWNPFITFCYATKRAGFVRGFLSRRKVKEWRGWLIGRRRPKGCVGDHSSLVPTKRARWLMASASAAARSASSAREPTIQLANGFLSLLTAFKRRPKLILCQKKVVILRRRQAQAASKRQRERCQTQLDRSNRSNPPTNLPTFLPSFRSLAQSLLLLPNYCNRPLGFLNGK